MMNTKLFLILTLFSTGLSVLFSTIATAKGVENTQESAILSEGIGHKVYMTQKDFCNPDTLRKRFDSTALVEQRCEWEDVCPTCFKSEEPEPNHLVCRMVRVGSQKKYTYDPYYQHYNPDNGKAQEIYAYHPSFKKYYNGTCNASVTGNSQTPVDPERGLFSMVAVGDYVSDTRGPRAHFFGNVKIPAGRFADFKLLRQNFNVTQWVTVASKRIYGNGDEQTAQIEYESPDKIEAWYRVVMTSPNTQPTEITFQYLQLEGEKCEHVSDGCLDY